MYLRDVQLVLDPHDHILYGKLRETWAHIEDILRHFLPPKLDVNGQGKLVLALSTVVSARGKDYSEALGCATLRMDNFDPSEYLALQPSEQEARALDLLRRGLIQFCNRHSIDPAPMISACEQVKLHGYEFQTLYRKLCKSHVSKKIRAEILTTYRRGGTDVDFRVSQRSCGVVHERRLADGKSWWPEVWFDYFVSRWDGDKFVVESRTGQSTFEFDASHLL